MWPTSRAKCLPDPQQQQEKHMRNFISGLGTAVFGRDDLYFAAPIEKMFIYFILLFLGRA